MRFLLRTLSLSYLRLRMAKMVLTLLGIVIGVATLVSIRSAQTALVSGLRDTVDHIAGKAQLEVVCDVGVPEELLETVRNVPGVRAVAPVIEQVVVAQGPASGSLLVLGVDLVGDRQMRDYDFEDSQVFLEDPLSFLAQIDSIALCTSFADAAGLHLGDTLKLGISNGTKQVVIRGLFKARGFAEAFGGRVAVVDVYAAQSLFGRGPRFDRIEVRLKEGVQLEEASRRLAEVLGPGLRVQTPERRGAQMERMIYNFVVSFNITCAVALGVGAFLIFNTFAVSVNRRRHEIGILRALGATPRQVQTLFLLEAAILGITGGLLGLLVGAGLSQVSLKFISDIIQAVSGVSAGSPDARVDAPLVVLALSLGLFTSLVGAWGPARAAALVSPVQSLAKGVFAVRPRSLVWLRLAGGVAALLGACLVATLRPMSAVPLIATVIPLGFLGTLLLAGPAAQALLALITAPIDRLSPVSGRLAVDSLLGNKRRTAGTVIAITVSLAFVLGFNGYLLATRSAFLNWMYNLFQDDIYVRSSAKVWKPDFRFPPELREDLLRIPGVSTVGSYRGEKVFYQGEEILIKSVEIEDLVKRAKLEFQQGDMTSFSTGLAHERKCAVSDNFHTLYHLNVGDLVELETPQGRTRLPIAAIYTDYASDRGTIFLDRSLFVSLWKDGRVDIFAVNLQPEAEPQRVEQAIQNEIGTRFPALVSSHQQYTSEVRRMLDSFFQLTLMPLLTALVVAFIGIITSLMISVMERFREIGILKSLGARCYQIRRGVLVEALAIGLIGLALAVPPGFMLTLFMQTTVSEMLLGWSLPNRFPLSTFGMILAFLPPVSMLAAWIPVRQAIGIKVTEAISYE